mmetsp:Transcript_90821/g.256522  ORF Transcript_90821/g.256522 Transcript_90821/m.256522 type:complete len:375 (-) Transcript_90821:98-1222(-)
MAAAAGNTRRLPFVGGRAEIPAPRQRTPSPVAKVYTQNTLTTLNKLARDFHYDTSAIDVIYAEDEEVFRETAIRELVKVGFVRSNIYESENGLGALHHLAHLQEVGHLTSPLVVLLDVRMPSMDGNECALQIQDLVKKGLLRREPFVICISSIHRQVIVEDGKGNFQVVLPKPFNNNQVDEALTALRKWWTIGQSRFLPAWKHFEPSLIDIIAADEEPVCRMAAFTAFQQAGVSASAITEVDEEDELMDCLISDKGNTDRPLVVLIESANWAKKIYDYVQETRGTNRREPFVVCTSIDADKISQSPDVKFFHAFLPTRFNQSDVRWLLQLCRFWWLSRGDGPSDPTESSASSVQSNPSVLSDVDEEEEDDEDED